MTLIGIAAEEVVLGLGIRAYSEAVRSVLSGMKIWRAPIETLYYIPVFMTLVVSFARYWEINMISSNNIKQSQKRKRSKKK